MSEYNWKKDKNCIRNTEKIGGSEQQFRTAPVRKGNGAKFFVGAVLAAILVIGGIILASSSNDSGNSSKATSESAASGTAGDWAHIAEKYGHAVGLVCLRVELKNGNTYSGPLGTAWAMSENQFVTNAHVIEGLKTQADKLCRILGESLFEKEMKKEGITSAKEYIKKFGKAKYESGIKRCTGVARSQIRNVSAEIRINNMKGKVFNILCFQIHRDYHKERGKDLGIITIKDEHNCFFKVASGKKLYALKSGIPVAYLGFPMENLAGKNVNTNSPIASMQTGIIVAVSDFNLKDGGEQNNYWIRHNLPTVGGASGSPIFDAEGNVVAVNKSISTIPGTRLPSAAQINFGVRIDLLSEMGAKIPIQKYLVLK